MPRSRRERTEIKDPRLSRFIHEHRGEILAAWEKQIRAMPTARDLDRPALIDHLPQLLDRIAQMADELAAGGHPQLPRDVAEVHAIERLGEGFDLGQVVFEYSVLRDTILRLREEQLLDRDHLLDLRLLNGAIDKAVAASIDRYTKARDRTLQALDQIANAALESPTLDEFLRRLLQTLVDTTAAVDTATILLRDGDTLQVRASVGLDDEGQQQVTQRIGQGFAGTIAATQRPLELKHAATDPITDRPALRASGVDALYGVPLLHDGAVIAVADMGSRTAHEFSTQDKKLFAAMANRATAAIFQHMLRETAERTAAQLRAREDELHAIADNIPQLTWMADANGTRYWYNRRWYEYTGLTAEESRGPVVPAAHDPQHLPRVLETWRHATATGQPWQEVFPLRGKNGRYRWFLGRAVPLRDEHGAVVRWFGSNTDVTDQRFLDEATQILSSSLDYLETLEQIAQLTVPDLCDWCVVDLVEGDGVRRVAMAHADPAKLELAREWARRFPTDWSALTGAANVLRTGRAEFATEVPDELLVKIARDPDHLQELRALGLASYVIVPMSARGHTLGTITLVTAESGRRFEASHVRVATELGQRAGMAVENARLYKDSQEAVHSRDEVLAIVSHDLRSPLGAIELAASSLGHEAGAESRTSKQIAVIRRSVARMEQLIEDLLDMASIQAKGLTLELASEDPARLIAEAVELHEALAADKGLKLIAECELRETIQCDRARIQQVFSNLIGNAIKYCHPGDVIFVRCERDAGQARFSVADTGPGIAPTEMENLFDPFWSAKRHLVKTGTGLGLYIAKGIVHAHGGALWVQSKLGEGATFFFTLPLHPPAGSP
jgi:PAS domain S-box-containing protein